jgi:hypothetical protein
MLLVAAPARAQDEGSLFERLNLDKLRFTGLGLAVGAVKPTQIAATEAYTVQADYGEIVPRWRVVFTATYWGSHYTPATVAEFRDTLKHVIRDSTGDYVIDIGEIKVSDIAVGTDARWSPVRADAARLRPFVALGVAAHVINAEGKAIRGTFVERALDNITAGFAAGVGADAVIFRHLRVGMQARYDLLSGARFGSVRVGATYMFEPATARAR